MKKIELTVEEGFQLQRELEHLLTLKNKIRLKFAITTIILDLKTKTEAGKLLIDELFRDYGIDVNGVRYLREFVEGTKEKTDEQKQYNELMAQQITLEFTPLDKSIEDIETDYPVKILDKLIEG
ncbi:MAG: hypothetical protein WKF91_21400 [Segetibacter sp.]